MSVTSMTRGFCKRILEGTDDFEGHAGMSKVDVRSGVIDQGLCRVQMIFPK